VQELFVIMSRSELKQFVDSGKLGITQVISPTRTISTALSIALAENGDGQVQEPLHHLRRCSFDEGLEIILNRAQFIQGEKEGEGKIGLVVKDIAKYVSVEEWKELLGLVDHVVFTIREPSQFLFSLVQRRANDMVKFGSAGLSREEVLERIPNIPEKLWRDGSWERIDRLLEIAESENSGKLVIVSGLSLRFDPFGTMERLSERFGWLPFNKNMVNNWTVASGANFFNPPPKYATSNYNTGLDEDGVVLTEYYRSAVQSSGFRPLDKEKDGPVDMKIFTSAMQEYLLGEVWPVYFRLLSHGLNISRPTIEQLNQTRCQGDLRFYQINPVEVFALLGGYSELDDSQETIRQQLLDGARNKLKRDHPLVLNRLGSLIAESV